MRSELHRGTANRLSRALFLIAVKGTNKTDRDLLLEQFPDRRSDQEILAERYVPSEIRTLASHHLQHGDLAHIDIKLLDHYLRVLDRVGALPANHMLLSRVFWQGGVSHAYHCEYFGQLASVLQKIEPGSPDIAVLRRAQKKFRGNHPKERKRQPKPDGPICRMVENARQVKSHSVGLPYSESTKAKHKYYLEKLQKFLNSNGKSFEITRVALDLFATHAHEKFRQHKAGNGGWSAITIAGIFKTLAIYTDDKALRRDLLRDAADYKIEASNSTKRKVLTLCAHPTSLKEMFARAVALTTWNGTLREPSQTQRVTTGGILGLLCFYPLRRGDLIKLRYGKELTRTLSGWHLSSLLTQKTGSHAESVLLPSESTPLLDAALLQGIDQTNLWEVYERRSGECLWSDWKTGRPFAPETLTRNFKSLVGYSPHLLRTLWADHLIENGADRLKVSIALQHDNLISQKAYEVLADKFRLEKAAKALVSAAHA